MADADIFVLLLEFREVLCDLSFQCHGQCLYATADSQQGNLPVEGKAGDEQLRQITHGIDMTQLRRWLFASPERVVVGAAAEQQAVDVVECVDDAVGAAGEQQTVYLVQGAEDNHFIGNRRDDERSTACIHNLLIVPLAECRILAREVGSQSDDRSHRFSYKCLVGTLQVSVKIVVSQHVRVFLF